MAALGKRAASFSLLIVVLCSLFGLIYCEHTRHGRPGKYISVARTKRSEPMTVTADARDKGKTSAKSVPKVVEASGGGTVRAKRSASTDDDDTKPKPDVTVFPLNDSHQQVMIDWAGKGSKVVVTVTRDTVQSTKSASNILISYDYGTTFLDKTDEFKTKSGKQAIINKFYKNEKFTSRFVFSDVINKYLHTTLDEGKTIVSHKVAFTPSEVTHHPVDPTVILVYDEEDVERKLWISEDFGEMWRVIGVFVKSYYWFESTSPPTLYIEREEPSGRASVVASQNLFSDDSTFKTIITDVEEFEVKDEFMFAIKKVHLLGSHLPQPELQLWVSYRQGPFMKAEFPTTLEHQHYYIADTSEGQVMVCVAHDQVMSNLYVSSVPRSANHQVRFSLSLERILYFNPSTNWVDTWLSEVADKTFADLHPVEGVRGVFIASQLVPNYTKSASILGPEHLTSLITFDQGAQWKPLQPPRSDAEGNTIKCERSAGCSLHLSQELSRLYPATQTIPILSKKSAPGLILGTGTIGNSLKGHTALYLSTDAGINWYQVLRNNYLYTFGDHGGIILAVQVYQVNGTTDVIKYSTDEGETWHTVKFYDEELRVYGLMTEPGENTTVFTLFGSKADRHHWIFVKVDMRPVFQYQCTKDDYKTWSPSDGRSGRSCLLGRKQVYERRVPHSNCFNGENYDRPISVENCPCDRDDFECDFGFKDDVNRQECVRDPEDSIDPYAVPLTCSPGHFYNRTKGYRKVPGDTCEGGREYQYHPTTTACPVSEEQEFLLVSTRQEILRFDLVNPEAGLEPLPIPGLRMVIGLDFDMANNTVYWSDVNEKKIKRLCFDGHHDVETLVDTNLLSVEGLALDWISKNLYFVDGERKTLEVIRTDINYYGRMRRTILGGKDLDNPRGLAVHPVQGFLYITDWSESKPKVARSLLDGSNLMTLFGVNVVGWPNGITIDFQTDRIFFADAKLDYIASADLDGKNMRKIIVNSDKVMQPFALGVYKSQLFWDDWTVHQILQADKEFGWGISPIANFTKKGLVDLKVFGHWSQQGTNACGNRTASVCTHLCMGRPNNQFSCLCPDGMKVVKEGFIEKCQCPDGSKIQDDGTCSSLDSSCAANFFACGNGRCIPEQWVCDTDNDCGDSSDESEIKCGMRPCESPAWQCKNGHCIAPSWRCDYDNDCGDHSDEEDCHYAECPENTFRCKNGRCIHPNWKCDMEDDCRDGSDEANCTTSSAKHQCRGTEFTCSDGRCLPGSWRCDGDSDCADQSDEKNCTNVKCESWQFQCSGKQCIFSSWRCDGEEDCHDGSDEKNCSSITPPTPQPAIPFGPLIPPTNCTALMFRCENTHCIPFWWRCDGLDDCGDASDEDNCGRPGVHGNSTVAPAQTEPPIHTCNWDQFQCSDGSCQWEAWVCDGDKDCPNGEDEENCHQTESCDENQQFRCRHSGGCISSKQLCDGQRDCADGSDEDSCETPATHVSECPAGYFECDGGSCLEAFKHCNGNYECVDLSDEQNCSGDDDKTYAVVNIKVISKMNVSATLEWEVNAGAKNKDIEYMPSIIVKTKIGNPSAWKNYTWSSNSSRTLTELIPFTEYLLKVYIREINTTKIFLPTKSIVFTTEIGIPSPPVAVTVEQIEDNVKVSWQHPDHCNGPIENYKVYFSPPIPARENQVSGRTTELLVPSKGLNSPTSIWVIAINSVYSSNSSVHINYTRKTFDSYVHLEVDPVVNGSTVHLEWESIPEVDGYVISHSRPENEYMVGEVEKNTTATHIDISDLAPGLKYMIKIRAFKNNMLGPANPFPVVTTGEPLVAVEGLHAEVMKDAATTVKLTWNEPAYKAQKLRTTRKIQWEYTIIWGKSANDLKHAVNLGKTANTSYVVRGLEACEMYRIAVMVGGPIGIGPVDEKQISTGADSLAPPKNLRARRIDPANKTMTITWEPPCPHARNESLQYELLIRDFVNNKTSYYQLPSKKNITQSHQVISHWGGRYTVSVRTASPEARYSRPAVCNGPVIPPPDDLTFTPSDQSFYWRNNNRTPHELLTQNHSYVLYISTHSNMSDAALYPCDKPPLIVNDLSPGIVYYTTVAFKDVDGYLSPHSKMTRFEKSLGSEIVLSQNSVVGVAVSVFLVVVALIAVVGILAVRHRRLARSFLTFANTHYDRSQGTTLITTDHNLDEDDDSPMIRGFSDDEPMVIA